MRGRKKKPVERMIAEGDPSMLGKHKLEEKLSTIPKSALGLPACPDHLQGRARAAWEFWADELVRMQLDSRCDAMMLEGACVNYARAVDADLMIAKRGAVVYEPVFYRGKKQKNLSRVKKHPAVAISNAAWSQVKAFCSEFGLSPASRVHLSVVPAPNTGADIETLISGPMLTDAEKAKLQ